MIGTIPTGVGDVPVVGAVLTWRDRLGTFLVRSRIGRDAYSVDPGLYALGAPDDQSPVLVTANYKLSFDILRSSLGGRDAWILVLDTHGINVWCAAGKGTFGTDELVKRIEASELPLAVSHGVVVLPQLGAPGVSAPQVRRLVGFRAVWGPVRASDLPGFLDAHMRATPEMRRVAFGIRDRLVLIPVEMMPVLGIMLAILVANAAIAGLGGGGFSWSSAISSVLPTLAVLAAALVAGTVITPLLLPWLPGRMFSLKGAFAGAVGAAIVLPLVASAFHPLRLAASAILIVAGSSYLAMNFTGSTTFTSLSGVLKEMKVSLPWQVGGTGAAIALWIARAFVR